MHMKKTGVRHREILPAQRDAKQATNIHSGKFKNLLVEIRRHNVFIENP